MKTVGKSVLRHLVRKSVLQFNELNDGWICTIEREDICEELDRVIELCGFSSDDEVTIMLAVLILLGVLLEEFSLLHQNSATLCPTMKTKTLASGIVSGTASTNGNRRSGGRRRKRRSFACGIVSGLVLGLAPAALAQPTNFSVLRSFPVSDNPPGELVEGDDGALYSTTQGGPSTFGTVFKFNKDGTGYRTLHSFSFATPGGGATPQGALLKSVDGRLYGTTLSNLGTNNSGTVFTLGQDGAGFAVLRRFTGADGDGAEPATGVIEDQDGVLYGTTSLGGGTNNAGTIFKLNKDGSNYAVLHRFGAVGGVSEEPEAGLILGGDGLLYGTTRLGGDNNRGTVFKINRDGSGYAVLHRFSGVDGAWPTARLLESGGGLLFGTASLGGTNNNGTIFRMDRTGGGFLVIYHFGGAVEDAREPLAGLIKGSDGALYGTTWNGGTNNGGAIFKLNEDGTGYLVLHSFTDTQVEGVEPTQPLTLGSDGALYCTTLIGGAHGWGTIFRLGHVLRLPRFSGRPALLFAGIPGVTYQLDRSTDLQAWALLTTAVMPAEGLTGHDDGTTPADAAFYRLRVP